MSPIPRTARRLALPGALVPGVLAGGVLLTVLLGGSAGPPAAAAPATPPPPQDEPGETGEPVSAEYDLDVCGTCHEDVVTSFGRGPHTVIDSAEWAEERGPAFSCASCHGDLARHVEEGGGTGNIFAFGPETTPLAQSAVCLTCHGDEHPRFLRSQHSRAGVSCVTCHDVHHPQTASISLLRGGQTAPPPRPMDDLSLATRTCAECHSAVFTEFEFNERHRLQEGIMECQSCHDPHAPSPRGTLLAAHEQGCVTCHTDKEGPFVFEHGSVQVEGCTACHTPHGSPNRHMLTFQRTAELCFSCHAAVPGFHSRFNLQTVCTNCHTAVHGSNFDRFFLK